MHGYASPKKDVLFDRCELKILGGNTLPATAGTYSLRRNFYFNETRALLGVLLGNSGVANSFENSSREHSQA